MQVTVSGVLVVALQRRPPDPSDYGDVELQQQPQQGAAASSCPRCRNSLPEKDVNLYCAGCGRRKEAIGFAKKTALPHPPRIKRLIREMSSLLPSASAPTALGFRV